MPVACTPNGLADAAGGGCCCASHCLLIHVRTYVHDTCIPLIYTVCHPPGASLVFALPHEQRTTLASLATNLTHAPPNDVWYLQPQNDSLRTGAVPAQLRSALMSDALLEFGTTVFGAPPDAVNLWIGDCRSSTSVHKDPYENMYHVLHGSKTFVLLPPCDLHRLPMQTLVRHTWPPCMALSI